MAKISSSYEDFWQVLEAKAKELGLTDGDLPHVFTAVKNVVVSAGWADQTGAMSFLSESDKEACVQASFAEIERIAPKLEHERKLTFKSGFSPTKSNLKPGTTTAQISSTGTLSSSSLVAMGKPGDRCPRCSGSMQPVGLVNDKAALYCPKDRVVLPLAGDASIR